LSSDDEEYMTPSNVSATTPRQDDRAAHVLTAARLYSNSMPESPLKWGQINPNLHNYDLDAIEISGTFAIPNITNLWRQLEEMHSTSANLANKVHHIFFIIPHGIRDDTSSSLG
jgi:hypothetical protein